MIVMGGFSILGSFAPELELRAELREYREGMQRAAENRAAREALYRADTHGGKTPEETIELFLAALAKNDIVTASRYYELSVQPQAWESLKAELAKNGNMEQTRSFFEEVYKKGTKGCKNIESELGGCWFDYKYKTTEDETVGIRGRTEKIFIPKGSLETKSIGLSFNKYSEVWKITHPD